MGGPPNFKSREQAQEWQKAMKEGAPGFMVPPQATWDYNGTGTAQSEFLGMAQQASDATKKELDAAMKRREVPPAPPDLTDQSVQQARLRARRAAMGGGLASTFVTGPRGVQGPPTLGKPSLLGS